MSSQTVRTSSIKWAHYFRRPFSLYGASLWHHWYSGRRALKGQIAYKGKVAGKTRILISVDDIPKFKDGEILITINSNPTFMPAIRKAAAAIVSDEGGITCHAAIVSRELKIPCIVGIKIATRVFKDGDLVEVDAERGIVKKLSK